MLLTCAICGCAYLPTKPWDSDWCLSCMQLNFAALQDHPGAQSADEPALEQARRALAASVCQPITEPITARQRTIMAQMVARWEEDGLL